MTRKDKKFFIYVACILLLCVIKTKYLKNFAWVQYKVAVSYKEERAEVSFLVDTFISLIKFEDFLILCIKERILFSFILSLANLSESKRQVVRFGFIKDLW